MVKAQLFDDSIYLKGFIIKNNNDTVVGFIEHKNGYYSNVRYKVNENDRKKIKVDEAEVKRIKVGINSFDRIAVGNKSHLMKRIVKGEVSLYRFTDLKASSNGPNGGFSTYEVERLYVVKGNTAIKLKRRKFKEDIKKLLVDDTELYADIDKLKFNDSLLEYNLKNIISRYNSRRKNCP